MKLWKTTIVIWSQYPGGSTELEHLARDAVSGEPYCSHQTSELVDTEHDADWDGTEFFDLPDTQEV